MKIDLTSKDPAANMRPRIAAVIPCYRVSEHILGVLNSIGSEVGQVYVVDDACPDHSGDLVERECKDPRVKVIRHRANLGVGGAVMTGYAQAIADHAEVIVKIDGDGQMDPGLIPCFVDPILSGEADYTKGNRFFDLEAVRAMPNVRLAGNAVLSLMTKLSSGYWNLLDPTNGYTAIHADVARHLPFGKISNRYFFETDMLFRLNVLRAVVVDVPMEARYEDEISNLRISRVVGEFLFKHVRNFSKRIFYNYYLRDLSLASIELPVGLLMLCFGLGYGSYHWLDSARAGVVTPAGTVMLAAIPLLMGVQFILSFLGYDISTVPVKALHRKRALAGISRIANESKAVVTINTP